uniref:Uncharacterized protein n=1 Tax=Cacopsylla melanoneura TaxID=428564 RepID=A0A8D8VRU9_9HEMI
MSSPGFCLETLLEAAKFVELQEQQQQEQQKQVFVVAGESSKLLKETRLEPLSSLKQEDPIQVKGKEFPSLFQHCKSKKFRVSRNNKAKNIIYYHTLHRTVSHLKNINFSGERDFFFW